MRVIEARNVHDALPKGLSLLGEHGVRRASRNGPVVVAPWPVTTVYEQPQERVIFWPERNANPAFHLYEALWMLAGRNDLAPLTRYVSDFGRFSDDGVTLHGAYGWRWRKAYDEDQLATIAKRLRDDPTDRRCVLQMWDASYDLDMNGKDVPCNTMATFQVNDIGSLDLTVFCRSNDILLGCYGANAVHFSLLLEYMAIQIGRPVGIYRQVSVNWHAYEDQLGKASGIVRDALDRFYATPAFIPNPYRENQVYALTLWNGAVDELDQAVDELLLVADSGFSLARTGDPYEPWFDMAHAVLRAHHCWRTLAAPERYEQALAALALADPKADFVVAMREWVERRQAAWDAKMARVA